MDPEESRSGVRGRGGGLRLSGEGQKPAVVWTVAGFDPSSGAGVTADLMTFAAHGLFGCSAITALTVQSTVGVFGWEPVRPAWLRDTLRRLEEDTPAAGIKIGMLGTAEAAEVVVDFLRGSGSVSRSTTVWDPVLRSSSGRALFPEADVGLLQQRLLPLVGWITPNWAELATLTGTPVASVADAERAGVALARRNPGLRIVATGGEAEPPVDVVVQSGGQVEFLRGERVETTSTHGTGCAFSSALLCQLVLGAEPLEAAGRAKAFVQGALRRAPGIGRGRGPMDLLWPLWGATGGGTLLP